MTFFFFSQTAEDEGKEHVQCTPLKINGWFRSFSSEKLVIFVGEPAINLGFCGYFEGVGALFGLAQSYPCFVNDTLCW